MNKEQALDTIKMLCALESWTFSLKQTLPDYLHDQLQAAVAILETTVLSKDTGTTQRQLKPLTDEEIEAIVANYCLNVGDWSVNGFDVALAIEAKLKEKNT